ncbi:unnamed protein product, partial [Mesorhabditis belari]|uniref:VWFA domain-containing protein n=1 Tax=Mesorhabditis belari TaxID=2138241 RepID=A0AAF3FCZ6_9BILA
MKLLIAAFIALATAQSDWTDPTDWTDPWQGSTVPPAANLGCGCNYSGLWLDVVLVVDSSSAMTQQGFQSLLSYIATAVLQMTIGQSAGQMSRFAVITYSSNATLRYSLTAFKNQNDLLNVVFTIPFEGRDGSNIEHGINVAQAELDKNGGGSYANRKKVLIIAASHYEPGASNDPGQAAATFRGNGGNIITIEYVQKHGTRVPILDSLASNCSSLSNSNEDVRVNDLLATFCRANCFCAANWDAYSRDSKCYTPDNGCYFPVTIPAAWPLAERYCTLQNGATLPTICNSDKAIFMTSLLQNRQQSQWTGLSRGGNGVFTWDDGTSYSQCQPNVNPRWLNGTALPGQPVALYSPSGFQTYFYGGYQYADFIYTCQNRPCSSTLYCS